MSKDIDGIYIEKSSHTHHHRSLTIMAPSAFEHVVIPTSTFLAPTSDNRGIPARKTQYQTPLQPSNGVSSGNARGPRLLTVDEALQYSPLSSIIPFSPGMCIDCRSLLLSLKQKLQGLMPQDQDIVPLPNARLPGSYSIFPTQAEKSGARQSLNVLDRDIAHSRGQSKLAQATLKELRPYLDKKVITNL